MVNAIIFYFYFFCKYSSVILFKVVVHVPKSLLEFFTFSILDDIREIIYYLHLFQKKIKNKFLHEYKDTEGGYGSFL